MKCRKKAVECEAIQWEVHNSSDVRIFVENNQIELDGTDLLVSGTRVRKGEWFVKNHYGLVYPIDDRIFKQQYELVQ